MLWKVATTGAAVLAAVLGTLLALAYLDNKALSQQIAVTEHRINDPKVGLVAQLAQAETNVVTVRTALTRQNAVLVARGRADAERLARVSDQLFDTQRQNRERLVIIDRLMALPPKGDSLIDRYNDIDRRLLETLQ